MRPSKAQSHCKIAWDAITSDSLKTSLMWLQSLNPISYCVLYVCVSSPWGTLGETPWVTRACGTKFALHLAFVFWSFVITVIWGTHAHTSYRFNKVKAIFKSQVQKVITSVQTNQMINRTHFSRSDLMYPHVRKRRVTKKMTNCRLDDLSHHILHRHPPGRLPQRSTWSTRPTPWQTPLTILRHCGMGLTSLSLAAQPEQ